MPKTQAGDIYLFKTEELYNMLGHSTFGTLLTEEQVKALKSDITKKEVLADYVEYKLRVYKGVNQ